MEIRPITVPEYDRVREEIDDPPQVPSSALITRDSPSSVTETSRRRVSPVRRHPFR